MDVREKLVELLNGVQHYGAICTMSQMDDRCASIKQVSNTEVAERLIAHGVTVQEWISAKDELPEECPHPYDDITKAVLIYTPVDGYTHIGWYAGKDYRGRDVWKTLSAMRSYQTCTKKVSHWCRLPQPPKGE